MKSVDKQDQEKMEAIASALSDQHDAIAVKVGEINDLISDLNGMVGAYNQHITEANELASEIATQIENYMDEKSDKWREGEAAERYESWLSDWQNVEVDDVSTFEELEWPDSVDDPFEEVSTTLPD